METVSKPENKASDIANRYGIPVNVIAELMRAKVIPRDLAQFKPEDVDFLYKYMTIFGDPVLLKLRLARIPIKERERMIKHSGDWELKRWEKYVIARFISLFEKSAQDPAVKINNGLVVLELSKYNIKETDWVFRRVKKLRAIAYKRFNAAKKSE